MLEVHQLPVLSDNYIYLLRDTETGTTGVVDPAVAEPVLQASRELGWSRLDYLLNTHHHRDHIGGNRDLVAETGCRVVGSRGDAGRIPEISELVEDGQTFQFGAQSVNVLELPGHTRGHIAFYFGAADALFIGDTLFALGCGRLFEGSAEEMWHSLKRVASLPPETRIYCAHEYTAGNARFALTQEPHNGALVDRAKQVMDLRKRSLPTVPSLLAEELATNPFLRWDSSEIRRNLGLEHAEPVAVFAALRRRKDEFV